MPVTRADMFLKLQARQYNYRPGADGPALKSNTGGHRLLATTGVRNWPSTTCSWNMLSYRKFVIYNKENPTCAGRLTCPEWHVLYCKKIRSTPTEKDKTVLQRRDRFLIRYLLFCEAEITSICADPVMLGTYKPMKNCDGTKVDPNIL